MSSKGKKSKEMRNSMIHSCLAGNFSLYPVAVVVKEMKLKLLY